MDAAIYVLLAFVVSGAAFTGLLHLMLAIAVQFGPEDD